MELAGAFHSIVQLAQRKREALPTNLSVDDIILDRRVQRQVVQRSGRQDPSHVDQLFQGDQLALHHLLELLRANKVFLEVHRRAGRRI